MARVYLGARKGSQGSAELVVIKQLRRDVAEDDQVLGMFVDEARIAMRLDHPNVVRTHEVLAADPAYCLVMEFLDGQSLLQVLRRLGWQGIPRDVHLWILTQVLAGLEYAHELADARGVSHGIVHRDVSPSNVHVSYTGAVKLLDFGIAKATGALAATQEGSVKGKVGYAAPEQVLGRPADPRADLYAVGVMLWEAIAGRRRSSGETRMSMLQGRLEDSEPALEEVCPDAPPVLLGITRRALERSPERRYGTAREFRAAIEQYLAAQPRRTGPADVAALLGRHFHADRAELRRVVEGQGIPFRSDPSVPSVRPSPTSGIPAAPAPAPQDPSLGPIDEDTSPIPVDDHLLKLSKRDSVTSAPPGPLAARVAPVAAQLDDPEPSERRGRGVWLAVGLAVAAAAGAGVFLARAKAPEADAAPVASDSARPATASANGTASGTASSAAATPIHIRISVEPRDAELRLDGRLLNRNPYTADVPRDGLEHVLTASAERRRDEKRTLRFDEDIDLELSLESSRGGRRGAAGAGPARGGPVAPPAPADSRPTAPRIEPGMDLDLRAPARGKVKIDEKDPYAK